MKKIGMIGAMAGAMSMAGSMASSMGHIIDSEEWSFTEPVRTCPQCGKRHQRTKSLSCSAECYKALRKKQKERL